MIRTSHLLRAGILAFGLACLSVPAANAVVVTVNSVQYDVTTVFGNFAGLQPQLQAQPWWGSESAATNFATAVGNQMGFPIGNIGFGPLLAFATVNTDVRTKAWVQASNSLSTVNLINGTSPTVGPLTFAVASPFGVPDSGVSVAMLGIALGGLIALRRRFA